MFSTACALFSQNTRGGDILQHRYPPPTSHRSRFCPPFVFIALRIAFPANSNSHPSESPQGVTLQHSFSTISVSLSLCRHLHQLSQRAKAYVLSNLPPLVLSCRFFSHSSPLFSAGCSLFSQNTGGWGRVSAERAHRTRKVRTSFTPSEHTFWSRTGSLDVPTVLSLTQRRRRLHIQLSLLQAQGSQVNG
jgi:hypothetical protein